MSTPKYGKLDEDVYDPSEDSFLMLDALEMHLIRSAPSSKAKTIVVEIGSGSGIVITFAATLIGPDATFIATDINPKAVLATQTTAALNNVSVEVHNTPFIDGLEARLAGNVDVLLFNPPYVLTPSGEVGGNNISAAWAGGINGREVIDILLPRVPSILSPQGRFYLLVLEQNKLIGSKDDIRHSIEGFVAEEVVRRKAGIELLTVYCFTRTGIA